MECITKQSGIYFYHFEDCFPHFPLTVSLFIKLCAGKNSFEVILLH